MILSYKVPKGLKYNNLVNKTKKEADLQMRRTNWWWPQETMVITVTGFREKDKDKKIQVQNSSLK